MVAGNYPINYLCITTTISICNNENSAQRKVTPLFFRVQNLICLNYDEHLVVMSVQWLKTAKSEFMAEESRPSSGRCHTQELILALQGTRRLPNRFPFLQMPVLVE